MLAHQLLIRALLLTLVVKAHEDILNTRPIIGILTQPFPFGSELAATTGSNNVPYNHTYIAASYVKFAESAGSQVVPLHFDAPDEELRSMFANINGIIFPGGGANLYKYPGNRFREASELLFNLALDANAKGDFFPIHGTCLGFELLSMLVAKDDQVLCHGCYESFGIPMALEFTSKAATSKLFSGMSAALMAALASKNLTENSHADGVMPETYAKNIALASFFHVLSTNVDNSGKRFVSTVEARDFPITATQWHPEKNNFEWAGVGPKGSAGIPHSADAVLVSQYFANYFINNARRSKHHFPSADTEAAALITNFAARSDPLGYFSQIYMWHAQHATGQRRFLMQQQKHTADTLLV